MGFLALVALALALIPVLFDVSPAVEQGFDVCEWVIVALFAAEYVVHLVRAPDRRAYVLSGWRLLDLATVVAPLLSILPQVSDTFRSSPVLRLLRLARAVAFGARAGGVIARDRVRPSRPATAGETRVSALQEGAALPVPVAWDDFLRRLPHGKGQWFHVSGARSGEIRQIAGVLGVPADVLGTLLVKESYPRIELLPPFVLVFVWLPGFRPDGRDIGRRGLFLLLGSDLLLTFAADLPDLPRWVVDAVRDLRLPAAPFPTQMTYGTLAFALRCNEWLAGWGEEAVRGLDNVPPQDTEPGFLHRSFQLKREFGAAQADLWRLKAVLAALMDQRVILPGFEPAHRDLLDRLGDQAEYLHETLEHLRESVVSLIELHINPGLLPNEQGHAAARHRQLPRSHSGRDRRLAGHERRRQPVAMDHRPSDVRCVDRHALLPLPVLLEGLVPVGPSGSPRRCETRHRIELGNPHRGDTRPDGRRAGHRVLGRRGGPVLTPPQQELHPDRPDGLPFRPGPPSGTHHG
jgi:hypothetical protein